VALKEVLGTWGGAGEVFGAQKNAEAPWLGASASTVTLIRAAPGRGAGQLDFRWRAICASLIDRLDAVSRSGLTP
jgi:hypothetical protein